MSDLEDFTNHPFNIPGQEKTEMQQLMTSIKTQGLLDFPVVRLLGNGKYQIISGHRRRKACEFNGYEAIPVKIVDYDDYEAKAFMISSNITRMQSVSFHEKVKACGILYNAMSHQGIDRSEDNKLITSNVAKIMGIREDLVRKYFELSRLGKLLTFMEEKRIAFDAGIEISKIAHDLLSTVEDILVKLLTNDTNTRIDKEVAKKILEFTDKSSITDITEEKLKEIISTQESKVRHSPIIFKFNVVSKYFPNMTSDNIKKEILNILKEKFPDNNQSTN